VHTRFRRRGVERREYSDAKTGRRVVQLTSNAEFESRHAYYDICPWSYDSRFLAFSSARTADVKDAYRDNLSTARGHVCVMDTQSGEAYVVAEDCFYTTHTGSMPVWRPGAHVLYFRRGSGTVSVDIHCGAEWRMDGSIRQISPDGQRYVGAPPRMEQVGNMEQVEDIYTAALDGSDPRCVATKQHLYDITPNRDEFDISEMTLGNTKWSPDGESILVAMWVKPRPAVRRSLYIVRHDGSESRWLTHFGHHHSWTPDGKAVLFNDWLVRRPDGTKAEPRMHLIDFDGANRRVLVDRPIGSHPIMSPDGKTIADSDREGVYLVHVEDGRVERLAEFAHGFDMSHKGTHPHCVWSPDGSQLLYNSAETGHSEVYMVPVGD